MAITWTNNIDPQKAEKIPGWVFFQENRLQARIHGNTFWNIKGTLEENFPIEDFLFDPIVLTLNHPQDYDGNFTGTIGRGEISMSWEKSGATINGRSPVGDFEIKGQSYVNYSP